MITMRETSEVAWALKWGQCDAPNSKYDRRMPALAAKKIAQRRVFETENMEGDIREGLSCSDV